MVKFLIHECGAVRYITEREINAELEKGNRISILHQVVKDKDGNTIVHLISNGGKAKCQ